MQPGVVAGVLRPEAWDDAQRDDREQHGFRHREPATLLVLSLSELFLLRLNDPHLDAQRFYVRSGDLLLGQLGERRTDVRERYLEIDAGRIQQHSFERRERLDPAPDHA